MRHYRRQGIISSFKNCQILPHFENVCAANWTIPSLPTPVLRAPFSPVQRHRKLQVNIPPTAFALRGRPPERWRFADTAGLIEIYPTPAYFKPYFNRFHQSPPAPTWPTAPV